MHVLSKNILNTENNRGYKVSSVKLSNKPKGTTVACENGSRFCVFFRSSTRSRKDRQVYVPVWYCRDDLYLISRCLDMFKPFLFSWPHAAVTRRKKRRKQRKPPLGAMQGAMLSNYWSLLFDMRVSTNGGTSKSSISNRIFHDKPSNNGIPIYGNLNINGW